MNHFSFANYGQRLLKTIFVGSTHNRIIVGMQEILSDNNQEFKF
jgi:hypothetical protein